MDKVQQSPQQFQASSRNYVQLYTEGRGVLMQMQIVESRERTRYRAATNDI